MDIVLFGTFTNKVVKVESKKKKYSFNFWASCSFKGSHHAAIINDSRCSSAPTAAFTIQMELSQKGNKTSYILGLWAGQEKGWLQQLLSSD